MDNALKITLGIVSAVLVIGVLGSYAMAHSGSGNMMNGLGGMMGNGFGMDGMMQGMMNGNFDRNQMHRAMHGEDADFDMNGMHQRMMMGTLTDEDLEEMEEHCPMMG